MSYEQEMQQRWIARRDANAFTELVQQHAGMVFATCRRVLGDATEAEDVAQECFMELAGATKVVKPSLGGWLHRVAVFRSLNRIRSDHRRKLREKAYSEAHPMTAEAGWDDIKPHLDEAIAELPEKFRLAVIQRFLEGKSQEDVAKALGVSRSTAQYRIERGVEEIRAFLKGRGITAAATALVALLETRTAEAAPATLTAALGHRALAAFPNALVVQGGIFGLAFLTWPTVVKAVLFAALGAGMLFFQYQKNFGTPAATPVDQPTVSTTGSSPVATAQDSNSRVTAPAEGKRAADLAPSLGSAVVAGRVYASENGEALGAFDVSAYPEGTKLDGTAEPMVSSRTGDDGFYELRGLSAGGYDVYAHDSSISYNVMIKAEGDGSSAPMLGGQTEVKVGDPAGEANADIVVDVGRCFAGQVVFGNGEPAPGVQVWARGENSEAKYWAERISDANGHVLFIGLEPETELYLQASNDGFASPVAGPFQVNEAREGAVVLRLDAAASIEGEVVDSTGKPAPGAVAWLRPNRGDTVRPRFVKADDSGRFAIGGLQGGDYDVLLAPVRAGMDDVTNGTIFFYWGTIENIFTDGDPVLRLSLERGERRSGVRLRYRSGVVSGRVTDLAGAPIKDAAVFIMRGPSTTSDNEGRFRLVGVADGPQRVGAYHEDFKSGEQSNVPPGSNTVELVLEPKGLIEGQVVDAKSGKPIPEFYLYAGPDGPYQGWMEGQFRKHADPDGRFTHKPNSVTERIFARADGYAVASVLATSVEAGQLPTKVTIALDLGRRASGIVVTQDGTPVKQAMIYRDAVPESSNRSNGVVAVSNQNGEFSLDSLPDESVVLAAWHEQYGYGRASTLGTVAPAEHVKIVLEKPSGLEGFATSGGEPLAGFGVTASAMPREVSSIDQMVGPLTFANTTTDAEGKFRFADLPAGNVQIICNLDLRSRRVNVEVVPGETATVAIDFPPGTATLEGHISREEGAPAEVATLSLMLSSPLGDESFHVESDPEGNYQIDGLPAGSYEVLIRIGEGIPVKFAEPLEIEDGAAVVRDFNAAEVTPIGTQTEGETVQIVVPLIR